MKTSDEFDDSIQSGALVEVIGKWSESVGVRMFVVGHIRSRAPLGEVWYELAVKPDGEKILEVRADQVRAVDVALRWIPVTERLPEEKIFVLAIDDCGNIYDAYMKNDYWLAPEGRSELLEGITHWMERPSPPKAEDAAHD
jgi:hypothetical protein